MSHSRTLHLSSRGVCACVNKRHTRDSVRCFLLPILTVPEGCVCGGVGGCGWVGQFSPFYLHDGEACKRSRWTAQDMVVHEFCVPFTHAWSVPVVQMYSLLCKAWYAMHDQLSSALWAMPVTSSTQQYNVFHLKSAVLTAWCSVILLSVSGRVWLASRMGKRQKFKHGRCTLQIYLLTRLYAKLLATCWQCTVQLGVNLNCVAWWIFFASHWHTLSSLYIPPPLSLTKVIGILQPK